MRTAVVGHVEWVDFLRVTHVPATGEILHADDWWQEPGGGGPGAAVQLLKLAGNCVFFTALGDDDLGRRTHAALVALGLRVEAVFRPEQQRRAIVHIDATGERTITVLGERLAPHAGDSLPWDALEGVDALYFTAGDTGALRLARSARVLVATPRAMPVLRGSGVRLDALVGSGSDPGERYTDGDLEPPPRLVVRTFGASGGELGPHGEPSRRYAPAPLPGPIVDSYGCGDSFAAGLTYSLAAGMTVDDAATLAARCGAAALTGRGPFEGQLRLAPSVTGDRPA